MNKAVLAFIAMLVLPGCVTEDNVVDLDESQSDYGELMGLNIVAQTLGRDVDVAHTYDLLDESANNSTLILWAAAGCKGCHQWTQMIRECVDNGTIPEDSNIVTVHRYPAFEMTTYVNNTYGNSSSDYYSPWPVLMPVDGATAWDATTGEESEVPLAEAFNNPVTPTLQVLDPRGPAGLAEQDLLPRLLRRGGVRGGDRIARADGNDKADLLLLRIVSEECVFEQWSLDDEVTTTVAVRARK